MRGSEITGCLPISPAGSRVARPDPPAAQVADTPAVGQRSAVAWTAIQHHVTFSTLTGEFYSPADGMDVRFTKHNN